MQYQTNFGGYQPTEQEQQEAERNIINELALGLGLGTAGAAAGIGLEINRRRDKGKQGWGQAAAELKTDTETALRVLLGRSAFDVGNEEALRKNIEVGGTTNLGDGYRSIRDYASKSASDSFYNVNKGPTYPATSVNTGKYTSGNIDTDYINRISNPVNASNGSKFNAPGSGGTTTNTYGASGFGSSYEKNPLTQAAIAARDAFNASAEDFLGTERQFRTTRGMTAEGPRSDTAFSRIPIVDAYRDLLSGKKIPGTNVGFPFTYSDDHYNFRKEENMNLMNRNAAQTAGSFLGRAGSDAVNNGVRSLWWLLNAPQAVADVVSEAATGGANRFGLYGNDLASYDEARNNNWINEEGEPLNPSVSQVSSKTKDPYLQQKIRDVKASVPPPERGDTSPRRDRVYARRRTGNNYSTLLALPAAIGINAGLGLNNPFGGSDGYKAAIPSEEDPTKTANVIGEVGVKYILGRRGDILPWDEYKKVRPDVSKEEYMDYKGYKYSKGWDVNPLDGDFNLGGVLKGTDDGLYGGEIMFLGKHMPTDTVLLPSVAAIGGAALGAALGKYGALNQAGIEESQERIRAKRNNILLGIGQNEDIEVIDPKTNKLRADLETPGLNNRQRDEIGKQLLNLDRRLEALDKKSSFIDRLAKNDFTIRGTKVEDGTGQSRRPTKLELDQQRINRWRNRNPVALGTALGLGSLGVASLIGNEAERRRREENLNNMYGT